MILPILTYAAEIWGYEYSVQIKKFMIVLVLSFYSCLGTHIQFYHEVKLADYHCVITITLKY